MSTSRSSWTTPIAPSTRTSATPGISRAGREARAQAGLDARHVARARSPARSRSIDALATAAASGLPMKVGPCASTGTSPVEMPSATSAVQSAAAIVM